MLIYIFYRLDNVLSTRILVHNAFFKMTFEEYCVTFKCSNEHLRFYENLLYFYRIQIMLIAPYFSMLFAAWDTILTYLLLECFFRVDEYFLVLIKAKKKDKNINLIKNIFLIFFRMYFFFILNFFMLLILFIFSWEYVDIANNDLLQTFKLHNYDTRYPWSAEEWEIFLRNHPEFKEHINQYSIKGFNATK